MKYWDLTLPNVEASPRDVRIADRLPLREVVPPRAVATIYLMDKLVVPAGVYPIPGHVRSPDQYGPTGFEFTGTEQLPAPADVRIGTGYGAGGTEYTGTLDAFTPAQIAQAVWTRTGRTLT